MRTAARDRLRRLLHENTEPARLGAAVAVGVVVGCSPFFGLHIGIGLLLAWALRLNKVAVILGAHISTPPLAPLLAFAGAQIGARLLHGAWLSLTIADFTPGRFPTLLRTLLLDWTVGGLIVGGVLALPAFLTVYTVARRRDVAHVASEDRSDWVASERRALELYRGGRPEHRIYLRLKVPRDPVYRMICERLGRVGSVVDLGTGLAILPALLAVRGQAGKIVAIEWDEAKLASARVACARLPNVALHAVDARSFPLPPADVVCLVDLLHYYGVEEQRALLERAASALCPGGRLVIRETLARPRGASGAIRFTQLLERISMRIRWNRGPRLVYRERDELLADLSKLGLECHLEPASSSLHAGNMLVWARKRDAGEALSAPRDRPPAERDERSRATDSSW